jgi:hypothetical protein
MDVAIPHPSATDPTPSATLSLVALSLVATLIMDSSVPITITTLIAANPALEEEGYVGHEDEEGDGES